MAWFGKIVGPKVMFMTVYKIAKNCSKIPLMHLEVQWLKVFDPRKSISMLKWIIKEAYLMLKVNLKIDIQGRQKTEIWNFIMHKRWALAYVIFFNFSTWITVSELRWIYLEMNWLTYKAKHWIRKNLLGSCMIGLIHW